MRILYSNSIFETSEARIIALWGVGLIGQAIYDTLKSCGTLIEEDHYFPWRNESLQIQAALAISGTLENRFLNAPGNQRRRMIFVWSAGRAGFSATPEETQEEMKAFRVVLNVAEQIQQRLDIPVEFHLVSSAGGLYEGCKHVERDDLPKPLRPYGKLKLDQELALVAIKGLIPFIYRVSSVYGIPYHGKRRSLIPVLLHHGLLRQAVYISGTPATLRDYLYVGDLARYIDSKIACSNSVMDNSGIFWMVSGRPSSIFEIRCIVEQVIRHPLYLSYKFNPENSNDITFAPNLRAPDFQPIAIRSGISLIYRHWQDIN